VAARDRDGRGHLGSRARKAHRVGTTDRDPGVTRVQRELERLGTRTVRTDGGSEVGEELVV
jgi:hypothetical protein